MVAVGRVDFYAALLVEGVLEWVERDVVLDLAWLFWSVSDNKLMLSDTFTQYKRYVNY